MGGSSYHFGSSGRSFAAGRSSLGAHSPSLGAAPVRAPPMPVSAAQKATRAFVKVLTALARSYGVSVTVTRDSTDACLLRAYRRLLLKVHPDKGGTVEDQQRLQSAKEEWHSAKSSGASAGRPARAPPSAQTTQGSTDLEAQHLATPGGETKGFRYQGAGVLLTYNGVRDQAQWRAFVTHVHAHVTAWQLKYWCATLEATKTERLHIHLMVQHLSAMDRTITRFRFQGLTPNAQPNDVLGEGFSRKKMQESLNRAFFYCWADKIGTQRDAAGAQCTTGNYEPSWTQASRTYAVKGRWPENLWKAHKLTHTVYEGYMYSCRDGVLARKRNLDACREKEATDAARREMEARVLRIRANPNLLRPFPEVPAARAWLETFQEDRLRYQVLVVVGPSSTGKTEWAKTLFTKPLELKIGTLQHFPDRTRTFTRGVHDGVILDDVRDLQFVVDHQEKVQGKYDALIEFGSTPGGHLSFHLDLFAVPVVVTANLTTQNLHFLGRPQNRVVVRFPLPAAAAHALE